MQWILPKTGEHSLSQALTEKHSRGGNEAREKLKKGIEKRKKWGGREQYMPAHLCKIFSIYLESSLHLVNSCFELFKHHPLQEVFFAAFRQT